MILALSFGDRVTNHFARRLRLLVLLFDTVEQGTTYYFALARQQDEVSGRFVRLLTEEKHYAVLT